MPDFSDRSYALPDEYPALPSRECVRRPWRGTLEDVKYLVEERVSYRSNFDLFFDLEPGGRNPRLRVMAHVEDTYDPGRTIIVTHTHPFPMVWLYHEVAEKHVIGWVFDCLKRVEVHECSEWFRLDGAMPYDPHHDGP